jgi:hypothetical protein
MYGLTILCGLLFAGIGAAHSYMKGRGFQFVHVVTQGGSGATFPTFLLMPFVPFDSHLMAAMAQSWVTVGLAGLLGAGVTLYGLFQLPHHKKRRDGYLSG